MNGYFAITLTGSQVFFLRVGGGGEWVERGGCAVYLSLGEVQGYSYLVPPESGQIIMDGELFLQLPDLVLGEGRPLFPRLDG